MKISAMNDARQNGRDAYDRGFRRDPLNDQTFLGSLGGVEDRDCVTLAHGWLDGWDSRAEEKTGRNQRPQVAEDFPHPKLLDPLGAFWVMDAFRTRDHLRGPIMQTYLERRGDWAHSLITSQRAKAGYPAEGMLWIELRAIARKLFSSRLEDRNRRAES